MKTYTVEIIEMVPHYAHVTVQADTPQEAKELALKTDRDTLTWDLAMESAEALEANGVWEGEVAYASKSL